VAGTLRSIKASEQISPSEPSEKVLDPAQEEQPVELNDVEIYAQEVLNALIADNLLPTPNNFALYFDRLLEQKTEAIRKQIASMLEVEENNDDENTIELEQNLKRGFSSVKNILTVTANLYKNITLMSKILDKRKKEIGDKKDIQKATNVLFALETDIEKLNNILKKQSRQMKSIYEETATIIKNVEQETIFDNQYGVYNKRYLLSRIEKEIVLIKQFQHSSSLILIELSKEITKQIKSEKATLLMTRTIARLLLKTSRRSDIVAHYGNGMFAMLLKHTDLEHAKKASERLVELVSNSNFFLGDKEIQLKIAIGITDIDAVHSVEEIVVAAMDGIEKAYKDPDADYAVALKDGLDTEI